MSGLITGKLFFRDLENICLDKKLYLLMGQLWVPASIDLKSENTYGLVGSDYVVKETGPQLVQAMGLQILLNGSVDISSESRKRHPSQIVSLLHTSRP